MIAGVLLWSHRMGKKEPACFLAMSRREGTEEAQFVTSSSSSGVVVGAAAAREHIERMRKDIHYIGREERNSLEE